MQFNGYSAWLACMSYGFPAWNSRAAMCEAVEVKPMLQWILKDIGDARKVEHPLREALKTKQSSPQAMGGLALLKPAENQMMPLNLPHIWTWSCGVWCLFVLVFVLFLFSFLAPPPFSESHVVQVGFKLTLQLGGDLEFLLCFLLLSDDVPPCLIYVVLQIKPVTHARPAVFQLSHISSPFVGLCLALS